MKEVIILEKWVEIRNMNVQGLGIRAISRKLRISRNTVRKALKNDSLSKKKEKEKHSKLEDFKETILAFCKQRLIGTRILHEIRKQGYTGSKSVFYEFLAELKKEEPDRKVTERYETPPAHQAQFDWSTYTVKLSGQLTRVIVFCLILSYSRRKFYWASLDETQKSVFEALEKGFWYFGGTCYELLVDNAKCFVTNANPEKFTWNVGFLELCGYYRIKPVACKVRRAQTKGKVERPFFYLEHHFIRGRAFVNFEDFSKELLAFCSELDITRHSTTGFVPLERFNEEKEQLIPLPSKPFISAFQLLRKVSWDCLISFGGSRYSVPYQFAGKHIWLKISQGKAIEIFSQNGEMIAVHKIASKGTTIIEKSHYEGLRKQSPKTLHVLKERFLKEFPEANIFLERLLGRYKFNPHYQLKGILELSALYPKEKVLSALSLAIQYNTFSHVFIRGILEQGDYQEQPIQLLPAIVEFPKLQIKRNLKDYQEDGWKSID